MNKLLIIALSLSLLSFGTAKRDNYDTNAKLKALYVYNFTKYIEWPASYKQGDFVIGILGDSPLFKELNTMAQTKKAGNQTIQVQKYSAASSIGRCHMLILPPAKGATIGDAVKRIQGNSTLVIGEQNGLATRGAGINFVVLNNKQKYELNKSNIEKYNLKVSSNLLSLAILVN